MIAWLMIFVLLIAINQKKRRQFFAELFGISMVCFGCCSFYSFHSPHSKRKFSSQTLTYQYIYDIRHWIQKICIPNVRTWKEIGRPKRPMKKKIKHQNDKKEKQWSGIKLFYKCGEYSNCREKKHLWLRRFLRSSEKVCEYKTKDGVEPKPHKPMHWLIHTQLTYCYFKETEKSIVLLVEMQQNAHRSRSDV